MKDTGKALGTASLWAGVAGLTYQFHSFGMLSSEGACWMVFGAFLLTVSIWKL